MHRYRATILICSRDRRTRSQNIHRSDHPLHGPGDWLAGLRLQDDRKHLYDLMIAMKQGDSLPNLMVQVNHYLTEINKKAS